MTSTEPRHAEANVTWSPGVSDGQGAYGLCDAVAEFGWCQDLDVGEFVTGQQAVGIRVGGRFRDLDDPDRFVWLRSFPDMRRRRCSLEAFYTGPVWRAHRDAANATMVDSDDVLLLRGPGFTPSPGTREVGATICQPPDAAAFAAYAARHLGPDHAPHRTEHAENDYPLLPVRTGLDVRVWFGPAEPPPWPVQELRLRSVTG